MGAVRRKEEAKGHPAPPPAKKPNIKLVDLDLVHAMEKRLTNLEGLSKAQRGEIKRKTEEIDSIKAEVQKLRAEVPKAKIDKYGQAMERNEKIRMENQEIKEFLSEYGLQWVGKEGQFNIKQLQTDLDVKGPAFRNNLPKEIDLQVVIKKIEMLNAVAEVDAKKVVEKLGVHTLAVFYAGDLPD